MPVQVRLSARGQKVVVGMFDWLFKIATFLTALAALFQACEQKRMRTLEARPVLTLEYASASEKDGGYYPISLRLVNHGKGPARLLKIESDKQYDDHNVANIGIPIHVGPGAPATIVVWLDKAEVETPVSLSACYWDTFGNCYSTEILVHLKWSKEGSTWRIDIDRQRKIRAKPPSKVVQWGPTSRGYPECINPWWLKERHLQ